MSTGPSAPAVDPPTLRGPRAEPGRPRRRPWLVVLVVLAVTAASAVAVLRGSYRDGPLEPDAPTPQGSRALVAVLEERGTTVDPVRHTTDAAAALRAGGTVLLTAPEDLSTRQLDVLDAARAEGGGRLVLVRPGFAALAVLAPDVVAAGTLEDPGTVTARDCAALDHRARTLETIGTAGASGPAALYRASGEATPCTGTPAGAGDGTALVVGTADVLVIGSADLLSNEGVARADNAGLALAALGGGPELTWYVPSASDPLATTGPSLLGHLPGWAGPLALWIGVLAVAAVLVAARRFGPVVVEPLPVSVRPQEIVLGRAGLLQRAGARDAAARSLRAATAARLADRLGLRRETTLDALLAALAPHVHGPERSPERLRALLGPAPVPDDRRLVELAADLDRLEKEIDR